MLSWGRAGRPRPAAAGRSRGRLHRSTGGWPRAGGSPGSGEVACKLRPRPRRHLDDLGSLVGGRPIAWSEGRNRRRAAGPSRMPRRRRRRRRKGGDAEEHGAVPRRAASPRLPPGSRRNPAADEKSRVPIVVITWMHPGDPIRAETREPSSRSSDGSPEPVPAREEAGPARPPPIPRSLRIRGRSGLLPRDARPVLSPAAPAPAPARRPCRAPARSPARRRRRER
jgi:hypothetical protein